MKNRRSCDCPDEKAIRPMNFLDSSEFPDDSEVAQPGKEVGRSQGQSGQPKKRKI